MLGAIEEFERDVILIEQLKDLKEQSLNKQATPQLVVALFRLIR